MTDMKDAINGMGQLHARQVTIHQWRVLSHRNEEVTAHEVDVNDLTCTCEDAEYNSPGNQVCDHVAYALFQADRGLDVGEALNKQLLETMTRMESHIEIIERRAMGVESDAVADKVNAKKPSPEPSQDADTADATADGVETYDDSDLISRLEQHLTKAGLDSDQFNIWVDDDFGSLQLEIDGYIDDFDAYQELTTDLGMTYDADNERNYLKPDEFGVLF